MQSARAGQGYCSTILHELNTIFVNCSITGIRLVGCRGSGRCREGRLEVLADSGYWGTVCDDGFEDIDARVACNSLGFGYVVNVI